MTDPFVLYYEASFDRRSKEQRLEDKIAYYERALARLRERPYVAERDLVKARIYQRLLESFREALARLNG